MNRINELKNQLNLEKNNTLKIKEDFLSNSKYIKKKF